MEKIYNTFGLEVYASEYITLRSVEEAQRVLPGLKGKRYFIVGGGSNLLFTGDYEGTIVHLNVNDNDNLNVNADGNNVLVKVPGSMVWDDFVKWCCEKGYWGVENLSYIPGEVGASAVQNIGAYGVEVKDVISRVYTIEVETGALRTFDVSECGYGYRDSIFKRELWQKYLVVAVEFRLSRVAMPRLEYKPLNTLFLDRFAHLDNLDVLDTTYKGPGLIEIREAVIRIRKEKLPEVGVIGSAGSFFKNPVVPVERFEKLKGEYPGIPHFDAVDGVKIPAAWLIDNAGLKGHKIGGAMVYEKQPLVIVNAGGAKAGDVVELAEYVIETVWGKYGVRLSPEVNYI